MRQSIPLPLALSLLLTLGHAQADTTAPCSPGFIRSVEARLPTGDGQGHGPDPGSAEWQSVVEFRLGLRGHPSVPERGSAAWCDWLASRLEARPAAAASLSAEGPAFDCARANGEIEQAICRDPSLAELDRRMDAVYRAALAKAGNEHPPMLKAEQRGWIKGRNDCWKADDRHRCVADSYVTRIAELQARYRLVPATGPFTFRCDDAPGSEVIVTHFETDPPTLIAERGDATSLMFRQPSASGSRYEGGNEAFWEHHGEARLRWGYGAAEVTCAAAAR
ncbi:MAG: MliC family protein [Rhodocyclaceae bacterium]|nr:MliC family protein [Rhodocyclaceae bacterium]